MAQRKPEYSPPTGAIGGTSFEEQTIEMFKAANSLQRGQKKPSFALKGDIWAKENASGDFLGIYEVQDPTSELDGNVLLGARATDEQLSTLTPSELEKYSINARQFAPIEYFRKSRIAVPYLANEVPDDPRIIQVDGREVDLVNFPETLQLAIDGKLLVGNNHGTWQLIEGTRYYCPNHVGRWYKAMLEAGILLESGLPNITGGYDQAYFSNQNSGLLFNQYGAFLPLEGSSAQSAIAANTGGGGLAQHARFNAASSNSIYGNSEEVQPQSITQIPLMYLGKLASEV